MVGTTVGRGVLAGCGVVVVGARLVGGVAGRDVEGTTLGEALGCVGAGETVTAG